MLQNLTPAQSTRSRDVHCWPVGSRPATRWDVTDHRLTRLGSITLMVRVDTGQPVYVVEGDDTGCYAELGHAVDAIVEGGARP